MIGISGPRQQIKNWQRKIFRSLFNRTVDLKLTSFSYSPLCGRIRTEKNRASNWPHNDFMHGWNRITLGARALFFLLFAVKIERRSRDCDELVTIAPAQENKPSGTQSKIEVKQAKITVFYQGCFNEDECNMTIRSIARALKFFFFLFLAKICRKISFLYFWKSCKCHKFCHSYDFKIVNRTSNRTIRSGSHISLWLLKKNKSDSRGFC